MLGGAKLLILGAKVWGPGVGSLERGNQPQPHQLEIWRSAVRSPSGVRDGALAAKMFSYILEAPHGLSQNMLGVKFRGGHDAFGPPIKSACVVWAA